MKKGYSTYRWKCAHFQCLGELYISQRGFSAILALLLTGFLVTLAAWVLFLFLSENRINQSLFAGTAAYHAAEGSMEYAMLKLKNHREGFADALVFGGTPGVDTASFEGNRIGEGFGLKAPRIGYEIISGGLTYNGTIASDSFAIIPLFREKWEDVLTQWEGGGKVFKKSTAPVLSSTNNGFWNYYQTPDITLSLTQGDGLSWNVIGNRNTDGTTFGISGKLFRLQLSSSVSPNDCIASECVVPSIGNISNTTQGNYRAYNNGELTQSSQSIWTFIWANRENYLVLYNPWVSVAAYTLVSTGEFTFPTTRIRSIGKVRDSLVQLELVQEKSDVYDILKYSLFVK